MNHADAVRLAADWLKRPACRKGPGCQVVVTESKIGWNNGEIPDALGFRAGVYQEASVLVECKASRADFLADAKKPHRTDAKRGMGLYRYYLAPAGVIRVDELPPGWGLIEVTDRGTLKVVCGHVLLRRDEEDCFRHERNQQNEWSLLARTLYRVGDPDSVNRRIRESHNRAERLARQVTDLEKQVRRLDAAYYHLSTHATEEVRIRAIEIRRGQAMATNAVLGIKAAVPRRIKETATQS